MILKSTQVDNSIWYTYYKSIFMFIDTALTILFFVWICWEQTQPQDRDYFGNVLAPEDPPMFI